LKRRKKKRGKERNRISWKEKKKKWGKTAFLGLSQR
jgi:hypothetical protein